MATWSVENYCDARGRIPVDDYLSAQPPKDRARILRTIGLLEDYGPSLRMPHARHLAGKVWELRIDSRPISHRILYAALPGGVFLLLHAFRKKSRKTPAREIETAQRHLTDYLEAHDE